MAAVIFLFCVKLVLIRNVTNYEFYCSDIHYVQYREKT